MGTDLGVPVVSPPTVTDPPAGAGSSFGTPVSGSGEVPARSSGPRRLVSWWGRRLVGWRPSVAWPLTWLLAAYPLWWALGLGVLIFPVMAVVMAWQLRSRRSARGVLRFGTGRPRVPAEVGVWLLFLVVVTLGTAALGVDPIGTQHNSVGGRLPGVLFRLVEYGSLTVLLVYAAAVREKALSQRRLVGLLGWLFVVTVAGGLLGTVAGRFQFSSPVELLLPAHLRNNSFVQSLVHPSAAQLMQVLGYASPRPAAPWGYTNTWGNNFALLVGWFVVAFLVWRPRGRRGRLIRLAAAGCLLVSLVPAVYSLNRGLWIDLGLAAVYVAVRLALRGRLWAVGALAGTVVLIGLLLAVTPLGGLVGNRLDHGESNNVRAYVTTKALDGMWQSPVIGLGTTRNTQGSDQSIAVGNTATCKRCGTHTIGGNGQLWQVLYLHGLLGATLYCGFFLLVLWRTRHDASPVGLAGGTAIVVSLASMLYYNSLVTPLAFTFLSCALLWRNRPVPGKAAA